MSVRDNLLRIFFERWTESFLKGDRFCCDLMHVRAALKAGEYRLVDFLCELFALARENHASSRAAKRFMRRRGHEVESVIERIFGCFACDKSGDVRDIHYRDGTDFARNGDKLRVIEFARI